jgi:hypothetical protein
MINSFMMVTHFRETDSVCDRRELADCNCQWKKNVKMLACIVVAIRVNVIGKTCVTNWYVILKHTQRAVEKLGLSPCHIDIVKKWNISI